MNFFTKLAMAKLSRRGTARASRAAVDAPSTAALELAAAQEQARAAVRDRDTWRERAERAEAMLQNIRVKIYLVTQEQPDDGESWKRGN